MYVAALRYNFMKLFYDISWNIVLDVRSRLLLQHRHVPRHFFRPDRDHGVQVEATIRHNLWCDKNSSNFITCFSGASTDQGFMDETYATGEGTDAWCSTHKTIPAAAFSAGAYKQPVCDSTSCIYISYSNFVFADAITNPEFCVRNNGPSSLTYNVHFVCQWIKSLCPNKNTALMCQ
jgi:hypothetical protein